MGLSVPIHRFMDGYFRPYNYIQTYNADNIRSTRQHITQQPEILKSNRRNNAFACQIERTYNLIGAYNISRETCGAEYILYTPLKHQCRNITAIRNTVLYRHITKILPNCANTLDKSNVRHTFYLQYTSDISGQLLFYHIIIFISSVSR